MKENSAGSGQFQRSALLMKPLVDRVEPMTVDGQLAMSRAAVKVYDLA
jgi:hypothetical protein